MQAIHTNYTTEVGLALLPIVSRWVLAGSMTFFIFVGMAKLVENNNEPQRVDPLPVVGNIIFEAEEEVTQTKTKPKPKPEVISPPVQALPKEEIMGEPSVGNFGENPITQVETIEIGPTFSQGGGEARPLVRINPKYPIDAANKGLEGWVKLRYTIAIDGSVTDVEVIDANPKRVFNREAVKALKRWKFTPLQIEGAATHQKGNVVVLDFKLDA